MPFNNPIPERKPREQKSGAVQSYIQTEKVVQIAIVLPVAVLLGWGGGAWLANHFQQPWMTLAGFVLGSVAGISAAIRMAIAFGGGPDKGGNGAGKSNPEDQS
jgi:F0F1-type ATP synthase assembly protein I